MSPCNKSTVIRLCIHAVVRTQMAGIEGSAELNDRQRFRGFYRTDATGEFMGPALAEIARRFNWTQMAVISRGVSFFLKVCMYM